MVVRLARSVVLCPASDRGSVAETALSGLLACLEPAWTTWPAENRPGAATAHQAAVAGQPNVGLTPDRLGTPNAGHRCRKIHRRAVQTQVPQTALPELENLSRAACSRTRLDRLLCRANCDIEGPICIGRPGSRSAPDRPFQRHRTSNGPMDGAAAYGGVSFRYRPVLSVARWRW